MQWGREPGTCSLSWSSTSSIDQAERSDLVHGRPRFTASSIPEAASGCFRVAEALYRWISLLVVADTVMADTVVADSAYATRTHPLHDHDRTSRQTQHSGLAQRGAARRSNPRVGRPSAQPRAQHGVGQD
jgi:hypothetical protein